MTGGMGSVAVNLAASRDEYEITTCLFRVQYQVTHFATDLPSLRVFLYMQAPQGRVL